MPPSANNRAVSAALAFVLFVTFALRLVAIAQTSQQAAQFFPLTDDSYYYFALGRNIATGQGPRVDALHPTTGFQPLWGALVVLPYLVSGGGTAVTLIQGMGALLGVASAMVVFLLTRRLAQSDGAALLGAALWGWSPQTLIHDVNGMETALAVLTTLGTFYALLRLYQAPSLRAAAFAGLVCGLAALTRVDTIVLAAAAGGALLVIPPRRGAPLPERLKLIAVFGACSVLPLLPWFAFALALGKGLTPESGSAVRTLAVLLGTVRPIPLDINALLYSDASAFPLFQRNGFRFINEIMLQVYVMAPSLWLPFSFSAPLYENLMVGTLGLAALLGIGGALAFPRREARALAAVWLAYALGMTFAYAVFVLADWFFFRYSYPVSETFTALAAALLLRALWRWKWGRVLSVGWIILTLAAYVAGTLQSPYTRWLVYGPEVQPHDGFYPMAQWINANLDPAARVGGFQTGLIGYYAVSPVINLDGKVNATAHQAMVQGQMWQYVCAAQLDYVVDWPILVHFYLVQRSTGWRDDNLIPLHEISSDLPNPLQIYRVNRANCPPPTGGTP